MAYIGKSPSTGVRNRFIYTATAGQTTFSGTDDHNRTLSYTDAEFTDVFLNGVKLDKSDYTATSGTSIVLDSGATVGDTLEILGFDTFSVFSGDFSQDVTVGGDMTISDKIVHAGDTNTAIRFPAADTVTIETAGSERVRVDSSGNVGIGTNSPAHELTIQTTSADPTLRIHADTDSSPVPALEFMRGTDDTFGADIYTDYRLSVDGGDLKYERAASGTTTEVMQLDSSGRFLFGKSSSDGGTAGVEMQPVTSTNSSLWITKNTTGSGVIYMNRTSSAGDGTMIFFAQAGTLEGNISVSGTTVSYNGGHLSRWSQLTDGTKNTSIVKGTVMTNLDQMAVWAHDAVDGKDAYTEDNEQLNCMAVSSVEGDANVAGVFVNWDNDDDGFNDMNVAMTGDMVIRIAQGTTVARGDLLMSAGDGTAKPQGDDIVRSKTIAKVTSTQVSHTYDDGTYLVPCVLMAC